MNPVDSPDRERNSAKTVVVGMSGGVDSSVVALLMREQGYRVIGLFMKNWEEKDENGVCQSVREYEDVSRVCDRLDIPHYSVEFVKEYWDNVFQKFLDEYQAGFTPNPDVLCNREIKFNVFFEKAMSFGADFLATGHYCRTDSGPDGTARLLKGADPGKDQSYFLNSVGAAPLAKTLFPVGHLLKSQVRDLAREHRLPVAEKKDSTGICFIGERNFKPFLERYLQSKPGDFRRLDGTRVGRHSGSAYYTLGQRKGLGLGGPGEAWFVVKKDHASNIVYVERGVEHPALYSDWLESSEVSWVSGQPPFSTLPYRCRAKVRYRQADQDCRITECSEGKLRVEFDVPQRAVTPGQFVAFYDGEICLGGGVIRTVGPSYFDQGRDLSGVPASS